MNATDDILKLAHARAESQHLPYAGALTPQEVFEVLQNNPQALLIDVRTQAELDLVGRIPNAHHLEWAFYPGMTPNAQFGAQLTQLAEKNATIIFMCRTGGRSHNAAILAQQLGYTDAYNMLEGFEGQANAEKQRTTMNGWRHAGLPWSN